MISKPNIDETNLLDRLACGELSDDERASLFEWLDVEPVRWRRCALVMLEAQLWSEGCEVLRSAGTSNRASVEPATVRQTSPGRRWLIGIGAVSALIGAFLLGNVSSAPAPLGTNPAGEKVVRSPFASNGGTSRDKNLQGANSRSVSGSLPLTPTQSLRIRADSESEVQLPVVNCPVVAREIVEHPPKLPDHIVNQWEKRGYQVKQSRHFVPVDVGSGKRLVIPVEEYQMKFVGNASS